MRQIWTGMKHRCSAESGDHNYWGRGIRVCDRWQSFDNFYADMGEPPEGWSIDRIDNDGNYEPGNCRWATAQEQANNKRVSRFFNFNGRSATLAQWATITGLPEGTLRHRIHHLNWATDRALTEPIWNRAP
jgi:hypothetical protein